MINGSHGGNDLAADIELDLSANINPLGMPEKARRAAMDCDWEKYPDPHCRKLKKKLSDCLGIGAEHIVCGNGADDLIYRSVSFLKPRRAVICAPTFSEYKKALLGQECEVREHKLLPENGFALTEKILSDMGDCDMVILCSPNNPNGRTVPPQFLERIAAECLRNGIYLLCDESFIGFTGRADELTALRILNDRVIVLRSFTKLYAMAGLRLGYAVCGNSSAAEGIESVGQYWSVSAPAQAAGEAALDDEDYLHETVSLIRREREYLSGVLADLGYEVFPSEANYILFRAHEELGEQLLAEGILIRSCADYSGLDGSYFRVTVGSRNTNDRLIKTVGRRSDG